MRRHAMPANFLKEGEIIDNSIEVRINLSKILSGVEVIPRHFAPGMNLRAVKRHSRS